MPRSLCSAQAASGGGLSFSAGTPFAATMRPRSIGTRSSVARGACALDEGVESLGIGRRDVDEIERRRLLRQRRQELTAQIAVDRDHRDQQRQAPGRATARRSASARPAGGCWRWQAERPASAGAAGAARSASAAPPPAAAARTRRRRRRRRSRRCAGHRRARPPAPPAAHADQHGRHDVAPARPAPIARDLVAEQRRDRHVMGAAERPQREGDGGQQPVEQRERQVARMQRRRERQRQHRAEAPGDQERQGRADRRGRAAPRARRAPAPA